MKKRSGKQPDRLPKENESKSKSDAVSLSPERIEDGVSTTTELLSEILNQPERDYNSRHWGINE